jgi:AraC-like DNA-binding protein
MTMYRYVRNKNGLPACGVLSISRDKHIYRPIVLHTTIGQDRPIGDIQTFREHRHNLYHIVLYTAGSGQCVLNRRQYTTAPGTVILVSPGQPHDFITCRGNAVYSELTFAFENEQNEPLTLPFDKLLEYWTGSPIDVLNPMRLSEPQLNLLNSLLTEIADLAGVEHPLSEFYLQYALIKLLHFIVQACTRPAVAGTIADERLVRVRQYIEQNYNSPIRIEELAQLAGFSKGYLFRSFRKAFGIAPLEYQQQLRLEAARSLLRATALRCSEIAIRCGYDNIHFFHRLFKNTFGITPQQYRKQIVES